jgi:hypothetical protein
LKNIFKAAIALLAIFCTMLVAAPAQARVAEADFPLPASMTGYKFGYTHICVNNGDNNLPISSATSWWNTAVDNSPLDQGLSLQIQYSNNCTNLGYPANKQFTVDSYASADNACGKMTGGSTTTNNGYRVWTGGLKVWVNLYAPYGCASTTVRRNHATSQAIGWALGFGILTSSGWASRVMCSCSVNDMSGPSVKEGDEAAGLYRGFYQGIY